jgi:membrane associated rhomboid family serine protease/Flp pilus assembly protein TadD
MDESRAAPPAPSPDDKEPEPADTARSFLEVLSKATPRAWVTPTLLAMNLLYFAWMAIHGVSVVAPQPWELVPFGANFGALALEGELWRTLSSTFIHIGLIHLGFNMWCLWALGGLAERLFGNVAFLLVYFTSGIGGSLASLVWHPERISAGASGAIFGLAGGLAAFLFLAHIPVPARIVRRLLTSLLFFIALNLMFGALWPGIDNAAHLGGLLTGLVMGGALKRSLPARPRSPVQYLVVPVVLAGFVALTMKARAGAADNPMMVVTRAAQLAFEGKRDAGVALLEELVADPPAIPEAHALLGAFYLEAGQADAAIEQYERAVESSPESAMYVSNLGLAHLQLKRYADAVPVLRRAAVLEPNEAEHHNRLSLALAATGEVDEALTAVEKALELQPEAPHILDSLGTVRYFRGETELAIDAYRSAIAKEPDYAIYRYNLSLALEKAGRHEAAREARRRAFELDPDLEAPQDGLPMM